MPQCQSDFQAGVIGECEKNVKGTWVAVQTHNIQKHTQVMQLCLLTAPVLYRHHPLLLASNPDIKKKGETGKRERERVSESEKEWDREEKDKEMYSGQIYVPLVCNEIDLLIPLM